MTEQHHNTAIPTAIKVPKHPNRISCISDNSICKESLFVSLLDQISSKDERIANLEAVVSSLEERLVAMSLELASSRAREDVHRLIAQQQRQKYLDGKKKASQYQDMKASSSTRTSTRPQRQRRLSRSWTDGMDEKQLEYADHVDTLQTKKKNSSSSRRESNILMQSLPNLGLGSFIDSFRRQSDTPLELEDTTSETIDDGSSVSQNPIPISHTVAERRASWFSTLQWPED